MKRSTKFSTKASILALGFLALFVLAACSDDAVQGPGVAIEVLAVADEVDTVTLEVDGQLLSKDATGGSVIFDLKDLPIAQTTFTARGLGDDIVLYKASKTVDLTANQTPVSLVMSRISSSVTVNANVAGAALSSDEVVVAKITGGLMQRLIVSDDGSSATGSLAGVATGVNVLTVSAYEDATLSTLTRQGSANITLSEDDVTVSVDLISLTSGQKAPDQPVINLPAEIVQGEPFDIAVQVGDINGDLLSVTVIWGDGSVSDPQTASDPYSDLLTFSHTYTAPDTEQNITVIVNDGTLSAQDTKTVQVTIPADDTTDVDVIVDTAEELSTVTLTVTGAPADAEQVQAIVTPAATANLTSLDLKDEYVVELIPRGGGTWSATLGLPQNVVYSVTINVLNENGVVVASNTSTFTPTEDTTTVPPISADGSGGTGDANADPVANAGADQSVTDSDNDGFATVALTGSASTDSDGTIVSYTWSAANVTLPAGVTTSAAFPVGSTVVTLTVSDNDGATATDTVTITVNAPDLPTNQAPSVDAGDDATVTLPASATLDGDVSDDDGDDLSTLWSKQSGPGTVTFGDAAAKDTTASFSAAGTYVLELSANDGTVSASDTVQIVVNPEVPVNTDPAVVPLSSTCGAAAVGDTCEVSVHLVNFDGVFQTVSFDLDLANDSYAINENSSGAGALTQSWFGVLIVENTDFFSVSGIDTSGSAGPGEVFVVALEKVAAGSDTLSVSNVLFTPEGGDEAAIGGGSLNLQ